MGRTKLEFNSALNKVRVMKKISAKNFDICTPKSPLGSRKLLSFEEAKKLSMLFKLLANDTRLRLIHSLVRKGELCVTDLADEVGMKPQAVSNQLQKLVSLSILESRRDGNLIYYRIIDACVPGLLHTAMCLIEDSERFK